MQIEFKIYQKYTNSEDFTHVGFERLNEQGNWEFLRNGRDTWLLGTISDNQGNAEFKRCLFTGLRDKAGLKIYERDLVRVKHCLPLLEVEYNEKYSEFMFVDKDDIRHTKSEDYNRTLIGNSFQEILD